MTLDGSSPEVRGRPRRDTTATSRSSAPATNASHPAKTRAAHETVELLLHSTPAGASVVRLDTGQRLGKTPLKVNVARKAATVWIQMAIEGYAPVRFTVDLRKDNKANVTLHGKKPKARR